MPVLRGSSWAIGGWIRGTHLFLIVGAITAAGSVAAGAPTHAWAADCALSIAIPDRWDDVTAIAGYAGGAKSATDWRNDDALDHEAFTDLNHNGLWDPGEPFVDANANGRFDAEAYDPLLTGYVLDPVAGNVLSPNGDLGLAITLVPAKAHATGIGRYVPFDCAGPSAASGPSGSVDRAMRDLVALDPGATWDPVSNQVTGSAFPGGSPRVILLPVYDPRFMATADRGGAPVTKVVATFVEQIVGHGSAVVRLTRVPAPGVRAALAIRSSATNSTSASSPSRPPSPSSSPPDPASWGRLKAIYR